MSEQSYYPSMEVEWNKGNYQNLPDPDPMDTCDDPNCSCGAALSNTPVYVKCSVCKGTGIDPESQKSYQDDEWDCSNCNGYGDIEMD